MELYWFQPGVCGINFTLLFLSTITWRQLYLGSTQKMITRLLNEKWEPILGGTSSCTTFWLLCSCLSSIRRWRSLKNTFHHTYLPTNIYFQKISISVLWGALRKTYCIWIDESEQSTYGSPQIIRRESYIVPYIQQADVMLPKQPSSYVGNQWFWYLCVVLFWK